MPFNWPKQLTESWVYKYLWSSYISLQENTQKLEAKLKGLVDDKKVLEQGLSDTKNRLEGELNVLSVSG